MSRVSLPADVRDALNRHGVFLKKKVLSTIRRETQVSVLGEELGFTFGGQRVLDILAAYHGPHIDVFFGIECKRVLAPERNWYFFQDAVGRHYRLSRVVGVDADESLFTTTQEPIICSEGYELFPKKAERGEKVMTADQSPVFEACAQLVGAYLGLVQSRRTNWNSTKFTTGWGDVSRHHHFVPVLVTNARLYVLGKDHDTSLESGTVSGDIPHEETPFIVINHPFSTPVGVEDFRARESSRDSRLRWDLAFKESVWVVNSGALHNFFAPQRWELEATKKAHVVAEAVRVERRDRTGGLL